MRISPKALSAFLLLLMLQGIFAQAVPLAFAEEVVAEEAPAEEVVTEEVATEEEAPAAEESLPEGSETRSATVGGEEETADPNPITTPSRLHPEIDEFTGALTYRYDVVLPAGRNGLTPELSLTYNSLNEAKDSIVGFGWELSIPSISRINRRGAEAMYDRNEFSSSLSGELIELSDGSYVAKSEKGAFLKYERVGDSWEVTDKSGTVYTFGSSALSRQDDPTDDTRIYKWMLSEIRDTNDNFIAYEYYKTEGQIYPYFITYTGNGSTEGEFEVRFTRGTSWDSTPDSSRDFNVETSALISTINVTFDGSTVRRYDLTYTEGSNGELPLLETILESAYNAAHEESVLPLTSFDYQAVDEHFELAEDWDMCGFIDNYTARIDVNGDALPDCVRMEYFDTRSAPPLPTESYGVFMNTGSSWEFDPDWDMPIGGYMTYTANSMLFQDFTGDGLVDMYNHANRIFYENTGDSWVSSSTWGLPSPVPSGYGSYSLDDSKCEIIDVNGDALLDLVFLDNEEPTGDPSVDYGYQTFLNTGSGWELAEDWSMAIHPDGWGLTFYTDYTSLFAQIMDINGDALPDVVNQRYVYLNTGEGWELDSDWNMPRYLSGGWAYFDMADSVHNLFLDMNGDGLVDFVVSDSARHEYGVYLNAGSGWELDEDWDIPILSGSVYRNFNANYTRVEDFTGDGLPDFLSIYGETEYDALFVNFGTNWVEDTDWSLPVAESGFGYSFDPNGYTLLDVNGDSLDDYLVFSEEDEEDITGDPSVDTYYRLYLNTGEKGDRLSTISLSSGASIEASYKMQPIVDRNPGQDTQTLYVVDTLTTDDGLGTTATTSYDYEGGKYYFHEEQYRSFTGFQSVTKTDADGNVTITYNHQGNESDSGSHEPEDHEGKIGLAYRTERYDSSGNLLSAQVMNWGVDSPEDGQSYAHLDEQVSLDYNVSGAHRDRATSYTYDANGNVLTESHHGEVSADSDGSFTDDSSDDSYVLTAVYAVDTGDSAIRNKVSNEKITTPFGTTLQKTRYYYDGLTQGNVSTGNLTQVSQWDDAGSQWLNTQYAYNAFGLMTLSRNPMLFATTYSYDDYYLYPATITNPKLFTVTMEYDYATGQITSRTDENGATSEFTYDGFGRILTVSVHDPVTGTLTLLSTSSYDDASMPRSATTTSTVSGVTSEQVDYFDGFGRKVQSNVLAEDGVYNTTDFWYDELGNLAQQSYPYETSSSTFGRDDSQYSVESTFDALGRPLTITDPNGSSSYSYDIWNNTITDANGVSKRYSYDANSQLVEVIEENEGEEYSTTYSYDPLGRLRTLTDAVGNLRAFAYDSLGRKTLETDLHSATETEFGTWTYTYDKNGNMLTRTDPKGQVITWTYDKLDRPTSENGVTYTYDTALRGKMRLAKITSNLLDTYTVYNTYDYLGNLSKETKYVKQPGLSTYYSYVFQTTSDLLGRPTKNIYPGSALTVNTTYNALGQVESVTRGTGTVTNVISDIDYSPLGQVSSMSYGNGATLTNTYDPAQAYRLTEKTTTSAAGEIQNLSYTYDAIGNILSIVDASTLSTAKTTTYTYDDLNRLLSASTSGRAAGDYTESYAYDSLGNMICKSDLTDVDCSTGVENMQYEGTGADGVNPHAVTNVAGTPYTYDLNGNLTSDGIRSYTWDAQNRLIAGGSMSFSYDASGQRYKSVDSSSGEYTYYLNSLMEMREGTSTSPGTPTYYIFAGSSRVAMREGSGANVIYNHQDHLGGTALTTDSAGGVNQIYDYYPYGAELENTLLGTVDAAHSFTDKELDDTLGLYYFEARWYSPTIARFASIDAWEGDPTNPQTLNKYAYSLNNPVNIVDRTGHYPVSTQVTDMSETSPIVSQAASYNSLSTDAALNNMVHAYGSGGELATSRYVYVGTGGWIDMRHFFSSAELADAVGYDLAIASGEAAEFFQQFSPLAGQKASSYSFEDLTSNTLGAYFGANYLPEKLEEGYTFDEALTMYFGGLGGVSADDAMNNHSTVDGGNYTWGMPETYTSEDSHPKSYESSVTSSDIEAKVNTNYSSL